MKFMKSNMGSSPLTWRILAHLRMPIDSAWIISTYVENTFSSWRSSLYRQDHLHIRGEYPRKNDKSEADFRIISTYVENTLNVFPWSWVVKDHLHIRGEYSIARWTTFCGSGSSPHTWRIRTRFTRNSDVFRIISTYVENTPNLGESLVAS